MANIRSIFPNDLTFKVLGVMHGKLTVDTVGVVKTSWPLERVQLEFMHVVT
jgi:putative lipoic acid-binding regulatory protein